jgi:aspartyl-tRNA(Asn)/glutamyl-tRNA(Gln) amidotransferase subunit C
MSSPEFNVRYVADLARLNLSDAEIDKFQSQLGAVLEYVEKLKRVNVEGIEPTAHAFPAFNVFRPDEPRDAFSAQQALANAPRQANELFIVPKVVE